MAPVAVVGVLLIPSQEFSIKVRPASAHNIDFVLSMEICMNTKARRCVANPVQGLRLPMGALPG